MAVYQTNQPSNIPTKPKNTTFNSMAFPNDLIKADNTRNFYTMINMVNYNTLTSIGSALGLSDDKYFINSSSTNGASAAPSDYINSYLLPIPMKINEVQTMQWAETSPEQLATSLLDQIKANAGQIIGTAINIASAGAGVASAISGKTVNPMLWMQFKQPDFKVHNLSWTLTPNNEKESNTIKDIINYLKKYSLPSVSLDGALLVYPNIAMIKFYPEDSFIFKLKPCAVTSVQVDYTAAGGPAFYKNGAPVAVNLTIGLKEIELWTQNNYGL